MVGIIDNTPVDPRHITDFFTQHLNADLQAVARSLECNPEQAYLLVHKVIATFNEVGGLQRADLNWGTQQSRKQWEGIVAERVFRPCLCRNLPQFFAAGAAQVNTEEDGPRGRLLRLVSEVPLEIKGGKLWNLHTWSTPVDALRQLELHLQRQQPSSLSCLKLFLTKSHLLPALSQLPVLVQFCDLLLRR